VPPTWVELFTSDTDRAVDFYSSLLGWTAEDTSGEYGGYRIFQRAGQQISGLIHNDGTSGGPDSWTVYLATENAAATAAAATRHGGQVVVGPMQVGKMGQMAVIGDPGGAAIGAWQPMAHTGFEAAGEVGDGSPVWFELHTRDYARCVDFYREVFGWDAHTLSDTEELRYTQCGEGDTAQAGIRDASGSLAEGTPAWWAVYFQVPDTDAAVGTVQDLGGSLVAAPESSPFGRMATVADPAGVRFGLIDETGTQPSSS